MTTEKFKLSRPLKTHNGELTELTLQEPKILSFLTNGEFFRIKHIKVPDGEPPQSDLIYDNNKAFIGFLKDMIVEKGIDELVLSEISASDFHPLRTLATTIILAGVGDKNFIGPSAASSES